MPPLRSAKNSLRGVLEVCNEAIYRQLLNEIASLRSQ